MIICVEREGNWHHFYIVRNLSIKDFSIEGEEKRSCKGWFYDFPFLDATVEAAELLLLLLLILFPVVEELEPAPPLYVCQIFLTAARP